MQKPVCSCILVLLAAVCFAQGDHVPAYNHGPLKPGEAQPVLPRTSCGEKPSNILQIRAYQLARKFPMCLNQIPCYCYCERIGHKSGPYLFRGNPRAHCASA